MDVKACRCSEPGNEERITAIVAVSSDDQHAASRLPAQAQQGECGRRGARHQLMPGNAAGDGRTIQGANLFDGVQSGGRRQSGHAADYTERSAHAGDGRMLVDELVSASGPWLRLTTPD